MPKISPDEALRYIHARRKEAKADFQLIADELEEMGYRGQRKNTVLSKYAVRFMFYNKKPSPGPIPPGPGRTGNHISLPAAAGTTDTKVETIRAVLSLKTSDSNKIKLIDSIINS
jgi:hypothetical protein